MGAGGAKIEPWISPPPSGHNNSMAMGTPHVKRWRGNIRLALFMRSHILAPRGQRLGKVIPHVTRRIPRPCRGQVN